MKLLVGYTKNVGWRSKLGRQPRAGFFSSRIKIIKANVGPFDIPIVTDLQLKKSEYFTKIGFKFYQRNNSGPPLYVQSSLVESVGQAIVYSRDLKNNFLTNQRVFSELVNLPQVNYTNRLRRAAISEYSRNKIWVYIYVLYIYPQRKFAK